VDGLEFGCRLVSDEVYQILEFLLLLPESSGLLCLAYKWSSSLWTVQAGC
jgi:hypothetical protein